ncbi:hypothetical protein RGU70_11675 [Herbaspirillum sp. RTI4]|uniref:hypothetical protein n=1 Tax=Herbaspirillum sp. RTI4 TaxID=3048640 RepID=UPI002AB3DA94|nr:hypothetical protein [Herbaspirillum sp. RTI4]MDY7578981.1 hypothetical protein [Herbaspirillum sp. RTI4]MEA9980912.1 hypothetical protein [Herbaspirillum sp. RTI4]
MLKLLMRILWPSFLVAIFAEGCFFSLVDPRQLAMSNDASTVNAVYTLGFFFFWFCGALASGLTCSLILMPEQKGKIR